MINTTVESIVGSYNATPASMVVGLDPGTQNAYLYCVAGEHPTRISLNETNQETALIASLVINSEKLGGHTFVTVIEGSVCLPTGKVEPSIRYILKTESTNELPRSGILDFFLSEGRLCLSIGPMAHSSIAVNYTEAELIYLNVGLGVTTVSGNQSEDSLQNKKLTPFGEQFVVAKTLVPLLAGAGIEMLFSLQAYLKQPEDAEIPNPRGGPVNPYARDAATRIAARM